MMWKQKIPPNLREQAYRELEPNETIQWIGTPIPNFFTTTSTGAFLFGIPWTAFALFWTWGAAGFSLPDFSKGFSGFSLFPLFGIPFILVGFGMLSSPLFNYLKSLKTVYLITDQRAITFEGGRSTTIRSYPPSRLQSIYRKEKKDGSGDVIFDHWTRKDSDDNAKLEERGFYKIREAKKVERMLKELAKRHEDYES